jgi:hypothetical protein
MINKVTITVVYLLFAFLFISYLACSHDYERVTGDYSSSESIYRGRTSRQIEDELNMRLGIITFQKYGSIVSLLAGVGLTIAFVRKKVNVTALIET